ncbi:MAG: tetratricopeptide repeat protein [Planctomycetota bacterium]|mgnify:CR=1 FL=1|nr:MAG: tetratricopeptide repeat protein [Planctomycetota bacterium]REJ91416.1 MAG: tetratricopeptide repeat protein [Planctomycetota bacterium]REK18464.1 MAG: tetratricopeptide repeat protein [Planctomycetota bacterium]REK39475.1 MAG: tetratricopeptide repeat protein [Planctomycetota bacterium]
MVVGPLRNVFQLNALGPAPKALADCRAHLQQNPDDLEAVALLCQLLDRQGDREQAIHQMEAAAGLVLTDPEDYLTLAETAESLGEFTRSRELAQRGLCLDSRHAGLRNHLASSCIDLGHFDEALRHLRAVLNHHPDSVAAFKMLADLASQRLYSFSRGELDRIVELIEDRRTSQEDACVLAFAHAVILETQEHHAEAFSQYQRANQLQRTLFQKAGLRFDAEPFCGFVDANIQYFTADVVHELSAWGDPSQTPVFVIGMPRSGTSLVEQILAAHPHAAGAGESPEIARIASDLSHIAKSNRPYPQCLSDCDRQTIQAAAHRYLDRLGWGRSGAERVVDKMIMNFIYLGLIHILFPQARVIHCQRDPKDVCLSCYFCSFGSIHWASRLQDIGVVYREYQRLMRHWRAVLPLRCLELRYEDLVRNPDAGTRRLLDFCELPWDDQCRDFFKREGTVRTGSRVQVRQPIYTSSIDRWKNYERFLSPLESWLPSSDD